MLGKLFKHEFKETYKLMIMLNLILAGLSAIGVIIIYSKVYLWNEGMAFLAMSTAMLYILSVLALFVVTIVYISIRFYKTMYSDQGYLTHTLPVSSFAIINTKLCVSFFWLFITSGMTALSVFLLIQTAMRNEGYNASFYGAIPFQLFFMQSEYSNLVYFIYLLLNTVKSLFCTILMIYASLAVGQLFLKYRVPASIVTYIVFYIAQLIISCITMVIRFYAENFFHTSFYQHAIWVSLIEGTLFCIFFYVLCQYITNKKLNLE